MANNGRQYVTIVCITDDFHWHTKNCVLAHIYAFHAISRFVIYSLRFFHVLEQYCEIGYETIKRESCHHLEASQLVCPVNQLTGFYMIATLRFKKLLVCKILEEKIIHYPIFFGQGCWGKKVFRPSYLLYGLKNTKKLLFGNEYLRIKFLIPNHGNLLSLLDCHITCFFYVYVTLYSRHKKWSFPLRISSVNVTKSAGNCGLGHTYGRNP